ncbi:MAG: hypothetical protein A2Y00_08280 [Omnitrophica WOR_2 bacterium GWF2_43_52]|nr:MAG: hypothetical protein A2062_02730 [Omnitrophica WOR_2 bacterium GWA2_44_7]OGX16088.1 MAG: hypothetical protein A2Y01_00410 [Omnitrophica WOR_2 bacterium GWC2_44_8]OGX21430.1 MAG: hypothetical protein A2Y00_08280 [Omnitrophica WOR_2 bacterium GWF2_43_52]HAH21940.1 hypothetical protein [Candidatus Omnitrophota bacterium]HBG64004.1 hypothetical protein [Candidatus Omnitrophota bacterium]
MITEIGITAGDIWHYLDQHGEVSFTQLVSGLDKSKDILFMSLGWLAREGHIILSPDGTNYKISLRR